MVHDEILPKEYLDWIRLKQDVRSLKFGSAWGHKYTGYRGKERNGNKRKSDCINRVHRQRPIQLYYKQDATLHEDFALAEFNAEDNSPFVVVVEATKSSSSSSSPIHNDISPPSLCLSLTSHAKERQNDELDNDDCCDVVSLTESWVTIESMSMQLVLPDMTTNNATCGGCHDNSWEVLSDDFGPIQSLDTTTTSRLHYFSYADAVRRQYPQNSVGGSSSTRLANASTTSHQFELDNNILNMLSGMDDASSVVNGDITVASIDATTTFWEDNHAVVRLSQMRVGTTIIKKIDPFQPVSMMGEEKPIHRGRISGQRSDGKLRWKRYRRSDGKKRWDPYPHRY